jgi:hypothetical protein
VGPGRASAHSRISRSPISGRSAAAEQRRPCTEHPSPRARSAPREQPQDCDCFAVRTITRSARRTGPRRRTRRRSRDREPTGAERDLPGPTPATASGRPAPPPSRAAARAPRTARGDNRRCSRRQPSLYAALRFISLTISVALALLVVAAVLLVEPVDPGVAALRVRAEPRGCPGRAPSSVTTCCAVPRRCGRAHEQEGGVLADPVLSHSCRRCRACCQARRAPPRRTAAQHVQGQTLALATRQCLDRPGRRLRYPPPNASAAPASTPPLRGSRRRSPAFQRRGRLRAFVGIGGGAFSACRRYGVAVPSGSL